MRNVLEGSATGLQVAPATDDNFEHLAKIATIKYA